MQAGRWGKRIVIASLKTDECRKRQMGIPSVARTDLSYAAGCAAGLLKCKKSCLAGRGNLLGWLKWGNYHVYICSRSETIENCEVMWRPVENGSQAANTAATYWPAVHYFILRYSLTHKTTLLTPPSPPHNKHRGQFRLLFKHYTIHATISALSSYRYYFHNASSTSSQNNVQIQLLFQRRKINFATLPTISKHHNPLYFLQSFDISPTFSQLYLLFKLNQIYKCAKCFCWCYTTY